MSPGRGVYSLGPRLRHLFGLGRVYLTRNEGLGLPALMEVPTGACPERVPSGAVQALVTAYPGPDAMLTVEQRAGRPEHLASVLDLGASLAEGALTEPHARAHLATGKVLYSRPMPPPVATPVKPSRVPAWATGLAAAGVLVALLAPWTAGHIYVEPLAPMSTPSPLVERLPQGDTATLLLTDLVRFSSTKESMTIGRVRVPDQPLPGQDTPPCPEGYVVIHGGCWAELKQRVPNCPKGSAEYKDGCYLPIKGDKPVPMSIDSQVRGRR